MGSDLLRGKVALVTGASRGIGAAIAARFAEEGARVIVSARTRADQPAALPGSIDETVDQIRAHGGTAEAVAADLSLATDRERLISEAGNLFGAIDVLVSNAAVTYFQPVQELSLRRLQLMFEVQVTAPLHLAQLALPAMVSKKQGWILNISSGAARHPSLPPTRRMSGGVAYGMCKAALERFSTGLASELWDHNIAVNALSPNRVVPTPGTVHHRLVRPEDPNQVVEPPEVMAAAALLLCSRAPQSLTGRIAYSQTLLDEAAS